MASKKSVTTPVTTRETAALQHGQHAEGAQYVQHGFAFTPTDDLAFALGFPHYRTLVDGHPDDKNAAEIAKSHILTFTPNERLELPREVAMRTARVLGSEKVSAHNLHEWTADANNAVMQAGAIGLDEANHMLSAMVCRTSPQLAPHLVVYILEALHGPEAIANMIVSSMETLEVPTRFADFLIYQLGFLFLRARPAVTAEFRARTIKVFEAWAKASNIALPLAIALKNAPNFDATLRVLDTVLYGAAGCARSLMPIVGGLDIRGVAHVLNNPKFVEQMVAQEVRPPSSVRDYPDARLAFLGGPDVLNAYASRVGRLKSAGERKRILDTFGLIRAPKVVEMMLSMTTTPKLKKEATAWLLSHVEYTRPIIEGFVQDKGPEMPAALAILPSLS